MSENSNRKLLTLPNGIQIAYQSKVEIEHFYEDIFEKEIYLKNGIVLGDGACVFDVGANIGLFTIFIQERFSHVVTYSFEPAPPLFQILGANTSRYGPNVRLFNYGVSNETKARAFTFYPNSSGMSSFYADLNEEKEVLRSVMLNQMRDGMPGMELLMKYADELLEERFKSEVYQCELRPLSEIISEQKVEQIDLLKIDAQKSERDVLDGILEPDWERIRQIVIEVHDIEGRRGDITALLKRQGYEVFTEQDRMYEQTVMYNLYAIRHRANAGLASKSSVQGRIEPSSLQSIQDRVQKSERAISHQRRLIERVRNKGKRPQ
jgi:FkbM family methyltransferase